MNTTIQAKHFMVWGYFCLDALPNLGEQMGTIYIKCKTISSTLRIPDMTKGFLNEKVIKYAREG